MCVIACDVSVETHAALDGAGVAGHGLNIASDFVPNEYGQGIWAKTTNKGKLYNICMIGTFLLYHVHSNHIM